MTKRRWGGRIPAAADRPTVFPLETERRALGKRIFLQVHDNGGFDGRNILGSKMEFHSAVCSHHVLTITSIAIDFAGPKAIPHSPRPSSRAPMRAQARLPCGRPRRC